MTRPWTPAEDATLREMWGDGIVVSDIVDALPGRCKNGILRRRRRLGLPLRNPVKATRTRNGPTENRLERRPPPRNACAGCGVREDEHHTFGCSRFRQKTLVRSRW